MSKKEEEKEVDGKSAENVEEVKEDIKAADEIKSEETKVDDISDDNAKPEETNDVVEDEVGVKEPLSDPFEDWSTVFGEFHKEMPPEVPIETPVWLNRDEIEMVAREQIKEWVKGVQEGKYPMPTGLIQTVDSTLEEVASPFPEKEFESVQKDIVEIKKSKEDANTRLDEITKSLEAMKKEIEVIRDTPIEVVEKSVVNDTKFEPKIKINSREKTITRK